jgi:hypothetical protein
MNRLTNPRGRPPGRGRRGAGRRVPLRQGTISNDLEFFQPTIYVATTLGARLVLRRSLHCASVLALRGTHHPAANFAHDSKSLALKESKGDHSTWHS